MGGGKKRGGFDFLKSISYNDITWHTYTLPKKDSQKKKKKKKKKKSRDTPLIFAEISILSPEIANFFISRNTDTD